MKGFLYKVLYKILPFFDRLSSEKLEDRFRRMKLQLVKD